MLDLKILGGRIRELRRKRGLTQTAFAEMLGVNRSTVSRTISRGRRNIMEKMKYFI